MNLYSELSKQWNSRPEDERFISTADMYQNAVEDKKATGVAGACRRRLRGEGE